jgi:hypothetical protein
MIGIHMRHDIRLGLEQRLCPGEIGEKIGRREIDDAAEPGHQMHAFGLDPEKREILEPGEILGGGMGGEIAPLQQARIGLRLLSDPPSMMRAPSSGSPGTRSSSISETRGSARIFLV